MATQTQTASQTKTTRIPAFDVIKDALQRYDEQLCDINHKVCHAPGAVCLAIYATSNVLTKFTNQIWSCPELAYEEHQAHDNICALFDTLSSHGYTVARCTYGVSTSFEINYSQGSGGRLVVFNAEYDALPDIGHACGHNLIATSSIAAFIATCEAMKSTYAGESCRVRLLGTPAEEGGGGKIRLLEAGAYNGVDACMMVHPVPMTRHVPEIHGSASPGGLIANTRVMITFTGRPAQASARPWEGINALDAVVASYLNISLLRQQILPSQRVHGIISDGGTRPNIIPETATMEYYIRSPDPKSLKSLTDSVVNCFEAAAKATGCGVKYEWVNTYLNIKVNAPICNTYMSAMRLLGKNVLFENSGIEGTMYGPSTDMGNVSHFIPGFHANFHIPTKGANHTHEFTSAAGSPEGYARCLDAAAGMAVVACEILTDEEYAKQVKKDFDVDRDFAEGGQYVTAKDSKGSCCC